MFSMQLLNLLTLDSHLAYTLSFQGVSMGSRVFVWLFAGKRRVKEALVDCRDLLAEKGSASTD